MARWSNQQWQFCCREDQPFTNKVIKNTYSRVPVNFSRSNIPLHSLRDIWCLLTGDWMNWNPPFPSITWCGEPTANKSPGYSGGWGSLAVISMHQLIPITFIIAHCVWQTSDEEKLTVVFGSFIFFFMMEDNPFIVYSFRHFDLS